MSRTRITTREFYEELKLLNQQRSADMESLHESLHSIRNKVDHLIEWAFGNKGEKGMDQKLRLLEDMHREERGRSQMQSKFWRIAQQLIAFTVGLLGAIIGAVL
jgi:hypothetical protein